MLHNTNARGRRYPPSPGVDAHCCCCHACRCCCLNRTNRPYGKAPQYQYRLTNFSHSSQNAIPPKTEAWPYMDRYFAEATAASASAIILSMRAVAEQPPPQCPEHEPHISFSPHMPFFIIRRTDRHTQTIKIASTTAVAIFITITASFQLGAHARHTFIHQVLYRFLSHTRS